MHRVFMIAACALAVAGCSSSSGLDVFKVTSQPVSLHVESQPPGADVTTSLGPTCKTPCALSITPEKDFSVSYALKGYKPETVSVQVATSDGKTFVDPNPLVMELEALPAEAKPRPVRRRRVVKKPVAAVSAPKPAAAAAVAPGPAAAPAPAPAASGAASSSPPPMTIPGSAAPAPANTPWPPIQQ